MCARRKCQSYKKQLTARNAVLLEFCTKTSKLADVLGRVKTQNASGGTASDDLKSVVDSSERLSKRAKVARPCEDLSTTTSTAAFSALLAE